MSSIERILVVDDDVDIAGLLQKKLTFLGYDVHLYHRATGAVDEARNTKAQLVLLDVMLGDGIGYQVARGIRAHPKLFKVPVLFQSVVKDAEDIAHAYSDGGDGYLAKPYATRDLEANLERMGRLVDEMKRVCPTTGMHSLEYLRRHADHRIFRREPLAVSYIFLDGIMDYQKAHGGKATEKIAFATGRAVRRAIRSGGFAEAKPCHLGGGYFMVMTELNDRKRFRTCVREEFEMERVPLLHAGVVLPGENGNGNGNGNDKSIRKQLLISSTNTEERPYKHASEMFDALTRLEKVAKKHAKERKREAGHSVWLE